MKYSDFSKYRTPLMGFAAVMIMLCHTASTSDFSRLGMLGTILKYGNSGVDIFLFLSGIGCYFSLTKEFDMKRFYLKRAANVLPVSLVLIALYCFAEIALGIKSGKSAVTGVLSLGSGNNPAWYIPCTLVLYFIYPFIFRLQNRRHGDCWLLFFAVLSVFTAFALCLKNRAGYREVEATLTRIPIFLFGTYCGKKVMNHAPVRCLWLSIPLAVLLCLIKNRLHNGTGTVVNRYFGSCIGLSVSLLFVAVLLLTEKPDSASQKKTVPVFTFFGTMSLETYLTHNLVKELFKVKKLLDLKTFFIIVIVSIIVSYPISLVRKRITEKVH